MFFDTFERFFGGSHGHGLKKGVSPKSRRLGLESLETREMLSVTPLGLQHFEYAETTLQAEYSPVISDATTKVAENTPLTFRGVNQGGGTIGSTLLYTFDVKWDEQDRIIDSSQMAVVSASGVGVYIDGITWDNYTQAKAYANSSMYDVYINNQLLTNIKTWQISIDEINERGSGDFAYYVDPDLLNIGTNTLRVVPRSTPEFTITIDAAAVELTVDTKEVAEVSNEYLSKTWVYENGHNINDKVKNADGEESNYSVTNIFKDGSGRIYAIAIKREASGDQSEESILVCRAPGDPLDTLADTNVNGIGYGLYQGQASALKNWARTASTTGNVSVTGHSMGGTLAQWLAVDLSREGVSLSEVETFNATGISKSAADQFIQGSTKVTHHIVDGDFVSMGGEAFINGTNYIYSVHGSNITDKHKLSLDDLSVKYGDITKETITTDILNDDWFYFEDDSCFELLSQASNNQSIVDIGGIFIRATAEMLRKQSGNSIYSTLIAAQSQSIQTFSLLAGNSGRVEASFKTNFQVYTGNVSAGMAFGQMSGGQGTVKLGTEFKKEAGKPGATTVSGGFEYKDAQGDSVGLGGGATLNGRTFQEFNGYIQTGQTIETGTGKIQAKERVDFNSKRNQDGGYDANFKGDFNINGDGYSAHVDATISSGEKGNYKITDWNSNGKYTFTQGSYVEFNTGKDKPSSVTGHASLSTDNGSEFDGDIKLQKDKDGSISMTGSSKTTINATSNEGTPVKVINSSSGMFKWNKDEKSLDATESTPGGKVNATEDLDTGDVKTRGLAPVPPQSQLKFKLLSSDQFFAVTASGSQGYLLTLNWSSSVSDPKGTIILSDNQRINETDMQNDGRFTVVENLSSETQRVFYVEFTVSEISQWQYEVSGVTETITPLLYSFVPPLEVEAKSITRNADGSFVFDIDSATATPDAIVTVYLDDDGEGFDGFSVYTTTLAELQNGWQPTDILQGTYHVYIRVECGDAVPEMVYFTETITITSLDVPKNLRCVSTAKTALTLDWNAAADATRYELQRKNNDGIYETIYSGDDSRYVDRELSPNTDYAYRVRALTETASSLFTDEYTVTTLGVAAPDVPTIFDASYDNETKRTSIEWTNLGSEYVYYVFKNGTPVSATGQSGSTYVDETPPPTAKYVVVAYNTETGEWTKALPTVLSTTPVKAEIAGHEITESDAVSLSWNIPESQQFIVYRNGIPVSGFVSDQSWVDASPAFGSLGSQYVLYANYLNDDGDSVWTWSPVYVVYTAR